MQERLEIYKCLKSEKKEEKDLIINSANEIYGACRHKTKFHRYTSLLNPSADDGIDPEKSAEKITPIKSLTTKSTKSTERKENRKILSVPTNSLYCVPITVTV